jgi:4'-phosphopantetheinyl transferase
MPLESLHIHPDTAWALWKITEKEHVLAHKIPGSEQPPANISNPMKRLEFLAVRVLLRDLLRHWDLEFTGLTKDDQGKPFFKNTSYHLSLSHSYPYVAAIIDRKKSVGIDLEQPKAKLLRIAPRVLSSEELEDAGSDITKHCIYWCAKEALIKVYGKRHLTLSEHLLIAPFSLGNEGTLSGRIIADDTIIPVPLYYRVYDNFVVALNM